MCRKTRKSKGWNTACSYKESCFSFFEFVIKHSCDHKTRPAPLPETLHFAFALKPKCLMWNPASSESFYLIVSRKIVLTWRYFTTASVWSSGSESWYTSSFRTPELPCCFSGWIMTRIDFKPERNQMQPQQLWIAGSISRAQIFCPYGFNNHNHQNP